MVLFHSLCGVSEVICHVSTFLCRIYFYLAAGRMGSIYKINPSLQLLCQLLHCASRQKELQFNFELISTSVKCSNVKQHTYHMSHVSQQINPFFHCMHSSPNSIHQHMTIHHHHTLGHILPYMLDKHIPLFYLQLQRIWHNGYISCSSMDLRQ